MKSNKRKIKEALWGLFFIAPVTLGLIVFYFYPFFQVIADSFYKIGAFDRRQGFVGLENYREMLQDAQMWQTRGNTFKYVIVIVPSTLLLSLLIAVLLNTNLRMLQIFSFFKLV